METTEEDAESEMFSDVQSQLINSQEQRRPASTYVGTATNFFRSPLAKDRNRLSKQTAMETLKNFLVPKNAIFC